MRRFVWPLLLACLAFAPALTGGFAYDDSEAIQGNPVVQGTLPTGVAFQQDYWHHLEDAGHYRPLASLSLRWDHYLWGTQAPGYHCTSLMLHLSVILLLGLLLGRVLGNTRPAFLGLIFFACHPALADSVAWISGRTSSLCALGGLAGLLILVGSKRKSPSNWSVTLGAGLAPFLACLGKEEGVVFVPLAILLGFWCGRGRAAIAGSLVGLALAGALRAWALGSPMPAAHGAPLAHLPLLERLLEGGFAWVGGLRLTALPLNFSPGQGFRDAGPLAPASTWIGGVFLVGLLIAGLTALRMHRRNSILAGSCLAVLASILPTLEIVPAGEVFAPRYLYLPLLCAAPLTGALLSRLPNKLLLLLLLVWIPLGWRASQPYTSRTAYWQARLELGQSSAQNWNALGNAHMEQEHFASARKAYEHATKLDPHYSRPWVNLAGLALTESGPLAALPLFERACQEGPNNPVAHANLGAVLLRLNNPTEAESHYLRATSLAPGRGVLWRGLARSLLAQSKHDQALKALEQARLLLGKDPATQRLLLEAQGD